MIVCVIVHKVLFNRAEHTAALTLEWAAAGLTGPRRVRDVWRKVDLGAFNGSFGVPVGPHAATMLRLTPTSSTIEPHLQ